MRRAPRGSIVAESDRISAPCTSQTEILLVHLVPPGFICRISSDLTLSGRIRRLERHDGRGGVWRQSSVCGWMTHTERISSSWYMAKKCAVTVPRCLSAYEKKASGRIWADR